MDGHSNSDIERNIIWADSSLEKIEAGYEELTIYVRESVGSVKLLRCLGYIGFQVVGFWDEIIIERAAVYSDHSFIADCEQRLKDLPESGSNTRSATGNCLLEVVLIDGCRLWVCANQLHCA